MKQKHPKRKTIKKDFDMIFPMDIHYMLEGRIGGDVERIGTFETPQEIFDMLPFPEKPLLADAVGYGEPRYSKVNFVKHIEFTYMGRKFELTFHHTKATGEP